jgi:N-acetylglutamate synthase-like GNAT family acetyltransferase
MSEITFFIREAASADAGSIRTLLARAGLDSEDVPAPGTRYWLAEAGGVALGVIGVEYGANAVLLRSAAVRPDARGRGVGVALVDAVLAAAAGEGYARAYLFSTNAGPYWARRGFREVGVPELVAALPGAPQVRQYERMGWLPTEVAWRRELGAEVV